MTNVVKTPRTWFATAAGGWLIVVERLRPVQLDLPGLGDWDVRALLGHSTRAFLTIETYLAADPAPITLHRPTDYFLASRGGLADPVAVTERGRAAGAALGEDPVTAAREIGIRVLDLVAARTDDAIATTPVGAIALRDYLPTRAFELTVHGLDLATATGQEIPDALTEAAADAVALAGELAGPELRRDLLFALTGRGSLTEGFSVL